MSKHGGFGFGGGMNMQSLMQQARKMQEQMEKAKQQLEEAELTGSAGGGLVTVTVDGNGAMKGVTIKPEAVDPDDIEMLEDLIIAAYNEAARAAEEMKESVMPAGVGM
ncbi:MAG TPA: YbaB/EbfC family nucleoid-associated protein [Candidatus Protoclostridium stercorigallinarum]|uniref:Nucleoid-associated protein H9892_02255 n=1 Tax=Candidatus Protoclostridium stercorigallinarum TaxID=2838741 RepID=A0A9D1PYI4_9FIRM|nr:YbaB/EbfC family nucleoid-associated protein [Candidatus Protoclostridium stercorigallinarum]